MIIYQLVKQGSPAVGQSRACRGGQATNRQATVVNPPTCPQQLISKTRQYPKLTCCWRVPRAHQTPAAPWTRHQCPHTPADRAKAQLVAITLTQSLRPGLGGFDSAEHGIIVEQSAVITVLLLARAALHEARAQLVLGGIHKRMLHAATSLHAPQ
jgi:hypothetical protein